MKLLRHRADTRTLLWIAIYYTLLGYGIFQGPETLGGWNLILIPALMYFSFCGAVIT